MILHGVATKDTKYVHATPLKNQILEKVPCLCETGKKKLTLFTLGSEMGRALFEACQSSSHDCGMIIAKATSVIHKQLFNNDEMFKGDMSREQKNGFYSTSLVLAYTTSVRRRTCNDKNYSTCSSNIANNISQFIRYNAVKYQRRDTVT